MALMDLAATRTAASSLARGPVSNATTAHRHSMSLRIKICRDVGGTWSVHGLSPVPVSDFPSLSASIDYARQACNAAPATIELYVDGMYIVAHQERGWPKALVASETRRSRPVPAGPDPARAALWRRLTAWLRVPGNPSTAASPASLRLV